MAINHKNILLAELSTSHLEVLYSQVKILLSSGNEIHLWINPQLQFEEKYFEGRLIIHKTENTESFSSLRKQLKTIIEQNGIDTIIFNTAHGLTVRNLSLYLLFKKTECLGVLHETDKLITSPTQKIISRKIKKYFVLSDSVAEYCRYNSKSGFEFESFYAIFPPFKTIPKPVSKETIITIPGEVSDIRRDYTGLIKFLSKHKNDIPHNLSFHFLGSTKTTNSTKIIQMINENKIENVIKFHTGYIPEEDFFGNVQTSDIIMPLIHPDTGSFNEYSASKISGAFNLAFAYKIPLFMHEYFKGHEDFEEISMFYDEENLLDCLIKITSNPAILDHYKSNYSRKTRFNFEFQTQKYLKFLTTSS